MQARDFDAWIPRLIVGGCLVLGACGSGPGRANRDGAMLSAGTGGDSGTGGGSGGVTQGDSGGTAGDGDVAASGGTTSAGGASGAGAGGTTSSGTSSGGKTSGGATTTGGATGPGAGGSAGTSAGGQVGGTTGSGGGGSGGASGAPDGASEDGGGAAGADGNGEQAGSCDELPCPELGTCAVERADGGCVRTCKFDAPYAIKSNADVARLAALGCTVIDGAVEVVAGEADSLVGLETVSTVTGDITIDGARLKSLQGLDRLAQAQSLTIEREDLESLVLPALRTVHQFTAMGLPKLAALRLPSLVKVDTTLTITACAILPSIELDALESAGQAINISLNDELMTVHGLPALKSVPDIQFTLNPKLPQCEVDAIAARFSTHCSCNLNDAQATCN
jgi:hypothetical protein